MKVLFSWLKDYVDIDIGVADLCERLMSAGFEVEEVIDLSTRFTNVFSGRIDVLEKHADSDKLNICKVSVGEKVLQIVTNSSSVKVGDTVPVALDGAVLATGQAIKEGRVRGVVSQGMFCGMEELGIEKTFYNSNDDGILILNGNEKTGENLIELLGLNDFMLDINITANRPDCNSVYGIAREVAAVLRQKCRSPRIDFNAAGISSADMIEVNVQDVELCPLYSVQAITDVKIAPSPAWLARRLNLCGIRSINNIVDITNYVLLELGQPMHAFDYSDIRDKKIIVRRAGKGEKIQLLDEIEYTLDNDVLIIADGQEAIGIAGVMGGAESGIKPCTNTVVFESAQFKKENIRRTGKRFGIRTEASARFEKGVDRYTPEFALSRALHLIEELGCAKICKDRLILGNKKVQHDIISFPYSSISRLLGIEIPRVISLEILNNLGIVSEIKEDIIYCTPPDYREDIKQSCDIIEEIIRYYGYHNIKPTLLENASCTMGGRTREQNENESLKDFLCANGFNETVSYSFLGEADYANSGLNSEGAIRLSNPLGKEMSIMRESLLPSMLKTIALNHNKKNLELNLFEIGRVYKAKTLPLNDFPEEPAMLCVAQSGERAGYYGLKAVIDNIVGRAGLSLQLSRASFRFLHPGISANIFVNGIYLGYIGQIHPQIAESYSKDGIFVCEINLSLLNEMTERETRYKKIGKFPAVNRDIAVVVDDTVLAGDILKLIRLTESCETAELFDFYKGSQTGEGKKSLAFSIIFRDAGRTLTDAEVDAIMATLIKKLTDHFGAELRK